MNDLIWINNNNIKGYYIIYMYYYARNINIIITTKIKF